MPGTMKNLKKRILFLLRIVFISSILSLVFAFLDVRTLRQSFERIGISIFALCLCFEWLFILVESLRIRTLSQKKYPFSAIWRSRFSSALVGNFLPGLASGEVVRVFLLDRVHPGNKSRVALILFASRIYGFLALATLFLIPLINMSDGLPAGVKESRWFLLIICILALFSPLGFQLKFVRRICAGTWRRTNGTLRVILRTILLALCRFTNGKQWVFSLLSSSATNLFVVAEFWLLSHAVGLQVTFELWCFIVPFVAVFTFLPMGLGAVGTQEVALIGAAKVIGLPMEPVVAVSIAMHMIRYLGPLPGLLYLNELFSETKNMYRAISLRNKSQKMGKGGSQ